MRVAIYFAVHGRLDILEVFLDGLKKLMGDHPDIDWLPFAVYSEDDEGEILEKHKIRSLKFDNEFLGRKKNAGLQALMDYDWDYLMELGSDDLVNPRLIDIYKEWWDEGVPAFGISSCYFVEVDTGKVAFWHNTYAIGAGRCISRKVFKDFGLRWKVRYKSSTSGDDGSYGKGKDMVYIRAIAERLVDGGVCDKVEDCNDPFGLWSDTRQIGLDSDSLMRLNMNGYNVKIIDVGEEPMIIDLKTEDNIHKFEVFDECEKSLKDITWDLAG